MRRSDFVAIVLLIALAVPVALRFFSTSCDHSRRAYCGSNIKQIVIAQTNYQSQRAASKGDRFLGGAPDSKGKPTADSDKTLRSDNSKAFVALAKLSLIDTLAAFACPEDPFIALLPVTGRSLPTDADDFPVEGNPAGAPWADPASPAATESGHTYYSYSMQTRGPNPYASFSPKMDPRIPMVADRNPYSVAQALGLDEAPTDRTDAGNAWAHNRRGQSVGYMDGRVAFPEDARSPLDPYGKSLGGYDYLYGDDVICPTPPAGPVPGSCPPRGQTAYMAGGRPVGWNVWMTD